MKTLRHVSILLALACLSGCASGDGYWASQLEGGPPDNLPIERSTGVPEYAISIDDKGHQSYEPTGVVFYPPGTY